VSVVSSYIHALDGRLRIKSAAVKGSLAKALEIEARLKEVHGVEQVKANPVTGNILIFYNPKEIEQAQVIATLQQLGYLEESTGYHVAATLPAQTLEGIGEVLARTVAEFLTETLVRSTMELAIRGLVSALI
jgi:copper chaperone CopZ